MATATHVNTAKIARTSAVHAPARMNPRLLTGEFAIHVHNEIVLNSLRFMRNAITDRQACQVHYGFLRPGKTGDMHLF